MGASIVASAERSRLKERIRALEERVWGLEMEKKSLTTELDKAKRRVTQGVLHIIDPVVLATAAVPALERALARARADQTVANQNVTRATEALRLRRERAAKGGAQVHASS